MVSSPTWSNGRNGSYFISKRLDRYFMVEALCDILGKYRTWHYSTSVLDHTVVILQTDIDRDYVSYSFKFNPTWLEVEEFTSMVKTRWGILTTKVPSHLRPMRALLYTLNKLQPMVSSWEKEMKCKADYLLSKIETDNLILEDIVVLDSFSEENRVALKDCHLSKQEILLHKEETLRQKSRAIWLKVGDENSRYFHNYANKMWLTNSVWEAVDTKDNRV